MQDQGLDSLDVIRRWAIILASSGRTALLLLETLGGRYTWGLLRHASAGQAMQD